MSKLTFNEENHQYFLDGSPYPLNISEIMTLLHDKVYKNTGAEVHKSLHI